MLTFQLQELRSLSLQAGEPEALTVERARLLNSGRLAEQVAISLDSLFDNEAGNANSLIADAQRALESVVDHDAGLSPAIELLDTASIQVAEAADLLRRYAAEIDMDPQRRDEVERRLDLIQSISRKHRVEPDELPALEQRLQGEFDDIENSSNAAKRCRLSSIHVLQLFCIGPRNSARADKKRHASLLKQ